MKPDRKLIEKFLRDQCTDAEAEVVQAYFNEYPGELEKYLPLKDWLADRKERLDTTASERMVQGIRASYKPSKPAFITRSFARYAVAASLIGIMVVAAMKLFNGKGRKVTEGTPAVTQITGSRQELKILENKTRHVMQVRLSDNSLVTVYPNSSLDYLPVFEGNKRELYLTGKAKFKVSKDPSRPFTVYAAGISTTALGTEFLVTVKDHQQVSVALMEGSVKVGSLHKADNNKFVVLRPGDELVVSSGQFSQYSLLHDASKNHNPSVIKSTGRDMPAKEENKLVFKNEQLKAVLKKIEEKFGVTINYEKAPGMEEKLFTGTFLEGDNLEFIIKMICHLHGLKYSIEGNSVTISM